MILHSRNLLLKSVLGGLFLASAVPVEAGCHGRSGGGSYGSSHSSSHNVYSSHVHSYPVYQQPVYSQPSYPQPVYSQPVYSQPQPVYGSSQPVYSQSQPVYNQSQPVYGQPQQQPQYGQVQQQVQQGMPTQSGYPTQQTYSTSGQPIQNGAMQGNTIQMAQAGSPLIGQGAGSSMMGGQTQVAGQPQFSQQGNVAQGNPMLQNGSIQNVSMPSGNAGSVQAGAAPVNPSLANAQQSALQALGGFAPPQAAVESSAMSTNVPGQQNPMAGSWTASLPNGARVQLALQADGNFSWTAINKDGQSSVFQGTYAVENGALSLTRGNDGQKLQGSMTMTGSNTFSFKLAADQSAALEFVRG